ncbi:ABC transporter substrate-binding protein [Leucobacter allii]|uniref:ABC transporter substrate-binding protein n=1 Tax=Leucobacter allii TaxID=2932247 RepID=A0ABY4FKK6_9MICO|nr:ABC transporter substrate-binding protein [Leucobacter allii]UOQ56426.1 ABC transporter substrate-binding protein [Leucobacter allii]
MRLGSRRRVLAAAVVALLGLGLTACQTGGAHGGGDEAAEAVELPALSELTPLEDPRAYEGPTTAVVGGPSIPPLAEAPAAELPVTVVSKDGAGDTEITVEDASRIVPLSLSGSVGELVYAFGLADHIVGRDISTSFPGSDEIPVITKDGHSVDAEAVLALNPSVIITDGSIGPVDVVLQLRDAGIPVVTVDRAIDPESSFATAQQVADALGIGDAAPGLVDTLRQAIADKEAEVAELRPEDPAKLPAWPSSTCAARRASSTSSARAAEWTASSAPSARSTWPRRSAGSARSR